MPAEQINWQVPHRFVFPRGGVGWRRRKTERFGEPEENRGGFESGRRKEKKWIIAQEGEKGQ